MKYKITLKVFYEEETGKIVREVWTLWKRLFWPLPWKKMGECKSSEEMKKFVKEQKIESPGWPWYGKDEKIL